MSYDYSKQLLSSQDYFNRSTRVLDEADSQFRPQEGVWTVAQQVSHAAQTLDWFVQGVSRPEGYDMDFAKHAQEVEAVTSLTAAREWLNKAYDHAIAFVRTKTPEQMAAPMPEGPIMGGAPLCDVVWAMIDHTAHHRGALTAYSRALGKVPVMPYGG